MTRLPGIVLALVLTLPGGAAADSLTRRFPLGTETLAHTTPRPRRDSRQVSLAHTHRDPHRRSPSSTKGDALVLIVWGFLALLVVSRIKLPDAAPPPPPSQARPPRQP